MNTPPSIEDIASMGRNLWGMNQGQSFTDERAEAMPAGGNEQCTAWHGKREAVQELKQQAETRMPTPVSLHQCLLVRSTLTGRPAIIGEAGGRQGRQ